MTYFLISGLVLGLLDQRSRSSDSCICVSDRIARAFNGSEATQAVALDISKAFDSVWYAGLLHKLGPYGISDEVFGLISSFLRNRRFRVVPDGKSSVNGVNGGVPQRSILGLTLFLL